jgi:hypothetical protein
VHRSLVPLALGVAGSRAAAVVEMITLMAVH